MREVRIKTEKGGIEEFDSIESLWDYKEIYNKKHIYNKFVGILSEENYRYTLIRIEDKYYGMRPNRWSSMLEGKRFFVFNSAKELLEWMKGGNHDMS